MNTWKLSSSDLFSLGLTIKGAWIYENMPEVGKLKEALAQIAATYPYLAGRYNPQTKAMEWDENAVGTIPFEEIDGTGHSMADVCGNPKLAWSIVKPFDINNFKKGNCQPFAVTLAHLSDGFVLYVQAAHALMDADTFYTIIGQWADLCKGNDITPMVLDQSVLPSPDAWSKEETLSKIIQQGWVKIGLKQILKMLWYARKNEAVKDTFSIVVPQDEIETYKKKSDAGTHGILTAIAAKKFYEHLPKRKTFKYITILDMRGRCKGVDERFMGNVSQAFPIGGDFDLSKSVEELAVEFTNQTRQFVSSGLPEEMLKLSVCASKHGLPYFMFDASNMNNLDPETIYINNQLKFRACELDWGHGFPAYAFPNQLTDMVKFWQPVANGPIHIVYEGLAAKIMKN